MRIKIIGNNNCARATRHLLRMAGFAVTEFLPAEAITKAPHFGYAITIELAPVPSSGHTPDASRKTLGVKPASAPDHSTHGQPATGKEGASAFVKTMADVSSPSFAEASAGGPSSTEADSISSIGFSLCGVGAEQNKGTQADGSHSLTTRAYATGGGGQAVGQVVHSKKTYSAGTIHFDSVDSALEAAVLRHVTQLAVDPVIVDRPGGVVHSERELRIIVQQTGDAKADEAAAVAVEFGVLRGLLDIVSPQSATPKEKSASVPDRVSSARPRKKWWKFGMVALAGIVLSFAGNLQAAPRHAVEKPRVGGAYLSISAAPMPEPIPPQGQFATATAVDPCKGQTKLYVSINQTANTQLVAGTSSKRIYICSIHVVVAAATNVALVEGTGSVCATGTSGVSGFGGATAATGWNFAANGGIALGNGDSSLGAEGTAADNLCLFNSGSGQVSGGISYVVQ